MCCAVLCRAEQVAELSDTLRRKGAMAHTTVVYAPQSSPPAQRFVALCTAVALAERARSKGDHALVVLDDLTCMVRCHALAGRSCTTSNMSLSGHVMSAF